jgi:hypothetical protein
MEGPTPESFERFMHHSGLLKLAWKHGGELLGVDDKDLVRVADVPFPKDIDDDIHSSRAVVRAAVDSLLSASK